jgi:ribosomal protein S18 acetylase RimI-like enzyme
VSGSPPITVSDATPADLDAVLPLHERAFAGTMGVALGRPYLTRFLRTFLGGGDRVFLVAREGDRAIGYVFGRPAEASDDRALLLYVGLGFVLHPTILARADIRAEVVRRLRGFDQAEEEAPGLPTPTLTLVGIGTEPGEWGRGVGRLLIEAFEQRTRTLGYASARLSVYRDNDRARHLYESCGWKPVDHPKPTLLCYTFEVDAAPSS